MLQNTCTRKKTRTPKPPAFWWYPLQPHDYQYFQVILDPKSKKDSQSYKFKVFAKISILSILKQKIIYMWHTYWSCLVRCVNEMDPTNIVEDTEPTRFSPQTDRWTDRRMDGWMDGQTDVKPVYPPPFHLCWGGGYNNKKKPKSNENWNGKDIPGSKISGHS